MDVAEYLNTCKCGERDPEKLVHCEELPLMRPECLVCHEKSLRAALAAGDEALAFLRACDAADGLRS